MDNAHIIQQIDITQIRENKSIRIRDSIIDEDVLSISFSQESKQCRAPRPAHKESGRG